jgi:ATP-dependent Clp protease ATP-binding subunit ClpA
MENLPKTTEELRKESLKFYPAIFLEGVIGSLSGNLYGFLLNILSVISGFMSVFILFSKTGANSFFAKDFIDSVINFAPVVFGTFLMSLAFQLTLVALKAFYHSFAFLDLVNEDGVQNPMGVTFELAQILYRNSDTNSVQAFLYSKPGQVAISRLGLSPNEILDFSSKSKSVPLSVLSIKSNSFKTDMEDFAWGLLGADKDFVLFLSSRGVTKDDFAGACSWAQFICEEIRKIKRWWSRDHLSRIPGIGKDWSYADVPTLAKYSSLVTETPFYRDASNVVSIRKKEIVDLEQVLSKIKGANALVVSDTNEESLSIIAGLGYMIEKGTAVPNLEHKLIYILDYTSILSSSKEKTIFEAHFRSALNETLKAGNIILVIKDLPGLMMATKEIGSDMLALLSWYFNSPNVHIIGTASVSSFHASIENNDAVMRNFEKILVKSVGLSPVLKYLKEEALRIEAETGVYFLYQALRASAESAERFFFSSSMEDKADDLLVEAASSSSLPKNKVIGRDAIMKIVEQKTGIPNNVAENSKDVSTLLNLEKMLSERVIGQEEAVRSVASAIRRAHSGVGNPNRPMGSFLFLGPTGVGKTETTKALADAFFGGESSIMRLDMSEYKTADALERLIGNFAIGKPGVLTSMLRDKPYGVLLLDEFEKTSKEVMDLFLQILDEGVFSDMSGRKVNARNLIIIATSNAGSEMIWKIVKEKGDNAVNKDEVISYIINTGIFKPELINRFDGAVIFKHLTREYLAKIAELMMKKLNKRLVEKGLEVFITPELINALVEKGTDPTFGARPMNRAIQDKIETMVADKILRGEAPQGTKIVFNQQDIVQVRS